MLKPFPPCTHDKLLILYFTSAEVRQRLRTGLGPVSVYPDVVENILRSARRHLEGYEAVILPRILWTGNRQAQSILARTLRDYAAHLQSLLPPLRKLPDEILRCIYDEYCDINYFNMVGPEPK